VFAADLWISPTDNAKRFAERGLDAKIFPFLVEIPLGERTWY
ncbi:MAG: hypothetical protein PWP25_1904, partial [Sphaerochaeta sp.]|nr:hypothetical protein [Sphaerochaeta sp.]